MNHDGNHTHGPIAVVDVPTWWWPDSNVDQLRCQLALNKKTDGARYPMSTQAICHVHMCIYINNIIMCIYCIYIYYIIMYTYILYYSVYIYYIMLYYILSCISMIIYVYIILSFVPGNQSAFVASLGTFHICLGR